MKPIVVRLTSNGDYWQARWVLPGGRRVTKSLGAKAHMTKRAAELECLKLSQSFNSKPGARAGKRCPRLSEYIKDHEAGLVGLSQATRTIRDLVLGRLTAFLSHDPLIDRVTQDDATAFWKFVNTNEFERDGRKYTLKPASAARHIIIARAVFASAVKGGMVATNPFASVRVPVIRSDKAWQQIDDAAFSRILSECPGMKYRCLFALARWAGLRLGEAMRLSWSDVDLDAGLLHVHAKDGIETTKSRTRITPIEPRLAALLRDAMLDAPKGSPGPCAGAKANNMYRRVSRIMKRAGVPDYAKPFHTLRKLLVTDWQSKYPPLDVAAWLGHDVKVAAEFYHRSKPETLALVTGTNLAQKPSPEIVSH